MRLLRLKIDLIEILMNLIWCDYSINSAELRRLIHYRIPDHPSHGQPQLNMHIYFMSVFQSSGLSAAEWL